MAPNPLSKPAWACTLWSGQTVADARGQKRSIQTGQGETNEREKEACWTGGGGETEVSGMYVGALTRLGP